MHENRTRYRVGNGNLNPSLFLYYYYYHCYNNNNYYY